MGPMDVFEEYFDSFNFGVDLRLILLISAVCFSLVLYYSKSKKNIPPGPKGIPLFGYFPFLGSRPYKTLNNLAKKYGNVFSLRIGQRLLVICNDWESMKEAYKSSKILNRPPHIFDGSPLGIGFGAANGREWVDQRRFSSRTMKEIGLGRPRWEQLMQDEISHLVGVIQERKGEPLDASELFSDTFTNNVLNLMVGYRLPFGHPTVKLMSEAMDAIMQVSPSLALSNFAPRLAGILSVFSSSSLQDKMNQFTAFVEKCIKQSLQDGETDGQESFVNRYYQEVLNNKRNNLKNTFTDQYMQGNTQTLIVGGSETTRTSMLWLLLAMTRFPKKQALVHQELDRVLGKEGRTKWADRSQIPYTYATIMEAQRWGTVVPINTLRMTFEDITINGFNVPKNTFVTSNVWAIHNDPNYWPDPETFEPERFLLDGGKQINFKPDSYTPFSFGKRNCPGEMIALMEILHYFTTLMQKFTLLPIEGDSGKVETIFGLTFQPVNVKLRFVPRE